MTSQRLRYIIRAGIHFVFYYLPISITGGIASTAAEASTCGGGEIELTVAAAVAVELCFVLSHEMSLLMSLKYS